MYVSQRGREGRMRVTGKYLTDWCNAKFKELEINDYVVTNVVSTKFSSDQIQGGACRLYILFKPIHYEPIHQSIFLCFYSMKEIQDYINGKKYGKNELYIKLGRNFSMTELELDIRSIT